MTGRPSDRAIATAFWETTRRVLNSHEEVEGLIINRARELDAGVGGETLVERLSALWTLLNDSGDKLGACDTIHEAMEVLTTPPAAVVADIKSSYPEIPEGWVLMPRKLDIDMEIAFAEQWFSKRRCVDDCELQDCYDALIAAAPAQEVG